ncbi:DNA cytosine methyltransferase [Polynucleobacter paneuropaeus]|nr:DNA cytosine methyltransferase [Polynucleobacter paneuropaeus]
MKTIKRNHKFKFVDLFAGCGGLSLGLELAGFEPIFVNELNPDALETYLKNRDFLHPLLREKYSNSDVKDLVANKGKNLQKLIQGLKEDYGVDIQNKELDLLVGGPPCQGFSAMGHRRSYAVNKNEVPSNYLYKDMAVIISKMKPKIFLFENVKGLMTSRWKKNGEPGEIWSDVKKSFKNIKIDGKQGYTIHSELVYSKYYGVPQNRPRVLLVGIRNDLNFISSKLSFANGFLPEPRNEFIDLKDLLGDLIDPNYENGGQTLAYPSSAQNNIQKWFRDNSFNGSFSKKGAPLAEHKYSNHRKEVIKKFTAMQKNGGLIPKSMKTKKFSLKLLPSAWGSKGPTITATTMPDDFVHYSQPRTLTVREWARLQTFPDWYQFSGSRTTGGVRRAGNPRQGLFEREAPKYTQIGNAVPVYLASSLGEHFKKILLSNSAYE